MFTDSRSRRSNIMTTGKVRLILAFVLIGGLLGSFG